MTARQLLCWLLCLLIAWPAQALQTPAATGTTIAATGTMEIIFTPEQDIAGSIIDAISHARKQILVQAFSFTHKDIAKALIAAHGRGVEVKLIADSDQTNHNTGEKISMIANAGIPVWLDGEHQSAHNKIILIDTGMPDVVVITGSYNFTYAAQFKNAENVLLIRGNNKLAQLYRDNWQHHASHAKRWQPNQ